MWKRKKFSAALPWTDQAPKRKEKKVQCTWADCSKMFVSQSAVTIHLRTHTGETPFKCLNCTKAFADKSSRKRHTRVHSGVKPFACRMCGRQFSQKSNKKRHERLVHRHMNGDKDETPSKPGINLAKVLKIEKIDVYEKDQMPKMEALNGSGVAWEHLTNYSLNPACIKKEDEQMRKRQRTNDAHSQVTNHTSGIPWNVDVKPPIPVPTGNKGQGLHHSDIGLANKNFELTKVIKFLNDKLSQCASQPVEPNIQARSMYNSPSQNFNPISDGTEQQNLRPSNPLLLDEIDFSLESTRPSIFDDIPITNSRDRGQSIVKLNQKIPLKAPSREMFSSPSRYQPITVRGFESQIIDAGPPPLAQPRDEFKRAIENPSMLLIPRDKYGRSEIPHMPSSKVNFKQEIPMSNGKVQESGLNTEQQRHAALNRVLALLDLKHAESFPKQYTPTATEKLPMNYFSISKQGSRYNHAPEFAHLPRETLQHLQPRQSSDSERQFHQFQQIAHPYEAPFLHNTHPSTVNGYGGQSMHQTEFTLANMLQHYQHKNAQIEQKHELEASLNMLVQNLEPPSSYDPELKDRERRALLCSKQ